MTSPLLDNQSKIAKLDAHKCLASIEQIGSQIQQVWDQAQQLTIPKEHQNCQKIVVAGMGGSVLGTDVITSLYADQLRVPIIICSDYQLPSYVDEKTLVIAASYSGNSAETVAALQDAITKKAKITGITSGGEIAQILQDHSAPVLVFETNFNPSNTARMGLGYSIFGQIALLARLGYLSISNQEVEEVLAAVAQTHVWTSVGVPQQDNPAKALAFGCLDQIISVVAAEHLSGAAHVFANQLNENAKTYAEYRIIPEMNHHLLEGFQFPSRLKNALQVLAFDSKFYTPENSSRLELSGQLIADHQVNVITHQMKLTSKHAQVWELIILGAYTAFYLAILHGVDPIPNPQVDELKSRLQTT